MPPISMTADHAHLEWALLACFVALLAHAGFALYETGLCRAKNASHTMAMNASVWALCAIGFFVCGFAFLRGGASSAIGLDRWLIHFGNWNVLGGRGFLLRGIASNPSALLLFFIMLCRVTITATIPTGALAERWRFKSFAIFSLIVGALIVPVYGCWIWGGGWIAQIGGIDYAGSSVIHLQGGAIALVTAWMLGPRIGKFDPRGRPRPLLGHHMPMSILGCLIISVALIALNSAQSLTLNDHRVLVVAVNSVLAAAAGATAACAQMVFAYGKPDPTVLCNGMIAGLAAISAPCAFVQPWAAMVIGIVAGVLAVWSVPFWERRGIDDPVGVVSVHGVNGLWGLIALGLFADDQLTQGLFYGHGRQLLLQGITAIACIAWSMIAGGVMFMIVGKIFGPNRVPRDVELAGLDIPELGVPAYRELLSPVSAEPSFIAEPRPASSPILSGQRRFSIVIEGVDSATLIGAWSGLCQTSAEPPSPDFKQVYPFLTTVTGNRFRFNGGEPSHMKESLSRLLQQVLPDKSVSAKLES